MTVEEMVERCPDIVKVTPNIMMEISNTRLNIPLDVNKSWYDNGYNDLDTVELIMELEKVLNINIPDDVVDTFIKINSKPMVFNSYLRNKKIEQLGL
jgi:acyl carrier protein